MVRVSWLRSLFVFRGHLSRRQRRGLASRRRRSGTLPVPCVQRLENRTLLAAPNPVDLGRLDGTTGFRLDGVAGGDSSGRSVSHAGDVNGDGFDDLIVGAFGADLNGNSDAGSSYVLFGRSGGFASVIDLGALDGTDGFRLDGVAASDQSGRSVSRAGDVNGDGFDDLSWVPGVPNRTAIRLPVPATSCSAVLEASLRSSVWDLSMEQTGFGWTVWRPTIAPASPSAVPGT